eukprot:TRINITY_DN1438_c0_g1_i2.p1 TRINITY_DN1438_c0_g1~~TRINITY_DN1438_c0_g1_i2.p1  ORF type:complete len:940 (-),score=121.53 TRINITY_DN1438_c0_g1_i2:470-3289(-)
MTDNAIATLLYDYYSTTSITGGTQPTAGGNTGGDGSNVGSPSSVSSNSSRMSSPRYEEGSSSHHLRHGSIGHSSSSPILISHSGAEIDPQTHTDNLLLSLAQTSSLDLQMRKRKKPEPALVEPTIPAVKPLRFIEERLPQNRSRLGSPSQRSPTEGVGQRVAAGGPPYSALASTRSPRAISPESRLYPASQYVAPYGEYTSRHVLPPSSSQHTPPFLYNSSPLSTPEFPAPAQAHSPPSSPSAALAATARQVHNQYQQQVKRQHQQRTVQQHQTVTYPIPQSQYRPVTTGASVPIPQYSSQRSSVEHTNNLSLALHSLEAYRKASIFFPLPSATMATEAVYAVINALHNGAMGRPMNPASFCTLLGLALGASLRGLKDFASMLLNEARGQLSEFFDSTNIEVAWGMCALSAFFCHFTLETERYSYFNVLSAQMCRRLALDTTEIKRWCLRNQFFAIMHQPKDLDSLEELNAVDEEARLMPLNSVQSASERVWRETTRSTIQITKLLTVLKACRQNGQQDPKESQRLKSATRVLRNLMRGFDAETSLPLVAIIASQLVVGALAAECLSMRGKTEATLRWAENIVNLLRSNRPILRYVVPQGFSFLASVLDIFMLFQRFDLASDMTECMGEWAPIYPCVAEMVTNYKAALRNVASSVPHVPSQPLAQHVQPAYQPPSIHQQFKVGEAKGNQSQRCSVPYSQSQRSSQPAAEEDVGQEREAKRIKLESTNILSLEAPSAALVCTPQPSAFTVSGNTEQITSGALSSIAAASVGAGVTSTGTHPGTINSFSFPSSWFEAELAASSSESWADVASGSSSALGLSAAVAPTNGTSLGSSVLMTGATDSLWHAATMADFSSSLMHISSYSSDSADVADDVCDDMFLSSGSGSSALGLGAVVDYEAELKRATASGGAAGSASGSAGGGFSGGMLPYLECNFLVGVFD